MKHTPGPWKFKSVIRPDAYRVQSGDDFVCEAKHLHDAMLIAAAPDLLEALRAAEGHLADELHNAHIHPIGECPTLNMIREAIAKAGAAE